MTRTHSRFEGWLAEGKTMNELFVTNPEAVLGLNDILAKFVRRYNLAVEALTEQQLAGVIRQAIASGDFMRHIVRDDSAQAVTYLPWREAESLRTRYHELIYAVASKHEGETRHETALRYIRERENQMGGPCRESQQSPT